MGAPPWDEGFGMSMIERGLFDDGACVLDEDA